MSLVSAHTTLIDYAERHRTKLFPSLQLRLGVRIPDPPSRKPRPSCPIIQLPLQRTPIHIAAQSGDVALIRKPLGFGYNIDTANSWGITALQELALKFCRPPADGTRQDLVAIRALCELGANVNLPLVLARRNAIPLNLTTSCRTPSR
jgi:hypothetical protein